MKMTYEGYIANPMGRKSAVFSNMDMYRDMYKDKLDKILVRENGIIDYTLLKDKGDRYLVYMKVPSEVIAEFYYDVVIEFTPDKKTDSSSRSLSNYNVKFFSNDPSFVYTFAHAFLKNDLFIKDLVPRMSKMAIKKVAVERNPSKEVGYVKSLFFAYLIMKRDGLFSKRKFELVGGTYKRSRLLKEIEHSDKKIADRKEAEDVKNKKEKIEKKRESRKTKNTSRFDSNTSTVLKTPFTRKTSKAKSAKRVKR